MDFLMRIPFSNGKSLSLGALSIPVFFFVVIGTVNGVNLTDGLDGLAASVTLMVAMLWLIISVFWHEGLFPVTGAAAGALLGFLLFNVHPASVFMGDTGSLALGAALATIAILTRHEISLILIGGVFVVETLSSLIQIIAIRKFHKKVFKKAPLHHHFEELGWEEIDIVKLFWTIGFLLSMIGVIYGVWL